MQTLFILLLFLCVVVLLYRLNRTEGYIKEIVRLLREYRSGNLSALLFLKGEGVTGELASQLANAFEQNQKQILLAQEQTRMLEATLRGMSDGVLMTDKNGTVILANQTLRRLFSIPSNPEGKRLPEIIRNNSLLDLFQRAMNTWEVLTEEIEITVYEKDIYVLVTAVPMYSASSVTGIVFTIQDITRIRKLEEVRKDFVANVSHEIKTPLTAIRAGVETILDSAFEDKETAARFLNIIKSHSERLNALVDDLLTLSRIELGDMPLEKTTFDLNEAIDIAIETLREKAEAKGLYIKRTHQEMQCLIKGDKNKVIQILLNLVDNGIKFSERGGITIGIVNSETSLSFYVEDTGIGIPKHHIERIGERFYRVDRNRSRELGGTGLGLAIVKHIVQLHGWNMQISSDLGVGTRITIATTL